MPAVTPTHRSHAQKYALVLDVGTTGIKAFVFDAALRPVYKAYAPLRKHFPQKDWVEQDPFDLLSISKKVMRRAVQESGIGADSCIGMGMTNQRETAVLWNTRTGAPVYPAIVWEDERTRAECRRWQKEFGEIARRTTGLSVTPYFSASKIWWILKHIRAARELLERNELAFGTVDAWILWNYVEGRPHCTDYTNASRTLLFNIHTLAWDTKLLRAFGIAFRLLPHVQPSQSMFGNLTQDILGFSLPVGAVCGDQQASLYAAGARRGVAKATFGTGTFLSQILGSQFALHEGFFTTLTANKKQPSYALEGKVEFYGASVQAVLHDKKALDAALKKSARMVSAHIKRLPLKPSHLIIDGGVTRNKKVAPLLSEASGLQVIPQAIFDGTALGIAKMLFRKT